MLKRPDTDKLDSGSGSCFVCFVSAANFNISENNSPQDNSVFLFANCE